VAFKGEVGREEGIDVLYMALSKEGVDYCRLTF
jgi:hypothetical protein